MSAFEDAIDLLPRRRLFSGRLRGRRIRGRHILCGALIAGVATIGLSTIGHREAPRPAAPEQSGAVAHFTTVQQPVEQILSEPPPPPVSMTSATAIETQSLPQDAAALDAGSGMGRITVGTVPLPAATRRELTEAVQPATANAPAPLAAPATEAAKTAKPSAKPTGRPANAADGPKQPERPAATVPDATVPAGSGWRVQLASVRSEAAANDAWVRLKRAHPDLLGGLAPATMRTVVDGAGTVFRVQAGAFRDRGGADRLCGALRRQDVACLIVIPR
jgi:cell division septation protein DedD